MRQDLDEKLCATYPELFRDRHASPTVTSMCWGFACGDGWYPLIDTLCGLLMSDLRHAKQGVAWIKNNPDLLAKAQAELAQATADLPVVDQVKEKFGGLRFYVTGGTDRQHAYIRFAEAMSFRICEECGTTAAVTTDGAVWIRTLCATCRIPT